MSTTRKRISIYDYPEHLNPFSECHLNVPDKRKIIVDKLRKNGTWSSKISKRLNRSVSWIEKSWLAVDDSPRRTCENRIYNDLHNNALYTKQSQAHNISRRESYSDVRHEETSHSMQILNGNLLEKSQSVENLSKCDTRKRKKRPAPLPPSPTSIPEVEKEPQEDHVELTDTCETEEKPQDDVLLHDNEIPSPEISKLEEKLVDEISTAGDNQAQRALCKQTLTPINELQLSDEMQNLQIESHTKEDERSKTSECSEHEVSQVEEDEKCEQVCEDMQPDENANIPSIKNENNSKIECNGKAVPVVNNQHQC